MTAGAYTEPLPGNNPSASRNGSGYWRSEGWDAEQMLAAADARGESGGEWESESCC
jgi:hypothetical protein